MTGSPPPPAEPPLDRDRHLRYFKRCLRSLLPHQYTSNDSTRMALAYFVIAAVDLLSAAPAHSSSSTASEPLLTPADRRRFRDWVLACQHTAGGFCGSPTHVVPRHECDGWDFAAGVPETGSPGAANIAATGFALLLLALLGDGEHGPGVFAGVDRRRTLRWLRQLQREDGSFGEVLVEMPAPASGEAVREAARPR